MDKNLIARQASARGMLPSTVLKDTLVGSGLIPLLPVAFNTPTVISNDDILRSLLYEATLFLLRSISQLVAYEAAIKQEQFSWASVTLYYANYYAIVSMNRLAGLATTTINTTSAIAGASYTVSYLANPSTFDVLKVKVNNHKQVWDDNYRLYETFNWRDSSLDGVVVRVPVSARQYNERKGREYINYHPEGYKEMLASASDRRTIRSIYGRYYNQSPDTLATLPFADELDKTVAWLESGAVARQTLLLTIFEQIQSELNAFPSSRQAIRQMFSGFRSHYLIRPPLTSVVFKSLYQSLFENVAP